MTQTAKKKAQKPGNSFNLSSALVDPKLSAEGKEFTMTNAYNVPTGAKLRIRPMNNRDFRRKLRKLTWGWMLENKVNPTKSDNLADLMPQEISEQMEKRAMGGTVLVGWSNLAADDKGTLIPYTELNAENILLDDSLWWFYEQVWGHAINSENWRGTVKLKLEKNSPGSSN